uniref:Uncharacterized protein n=1 Tax=Romanomermis culicivorax TaxID=13658 RepID=A0A915JR24_ROMCU
SRVISKTTSQRCIRPWATSYKLPSILSDRSVFANLTCYSSSNSLDRPSLNFATNRLCKFTCYGSIPTASVNPIKKEPRMPVVYFLHEQFFVLEVHLEKMWNVLEIKGFAKTKEKQKIEYGRRSA